MSTPEDAAVDAPAAGTWRDRVRVAPVASHTHLSVGDIVRDLHIGPVERVLLWLAKTDYYVLSLSTYHSRLILSGLGLMVIFTSLLAFSSALYALLTTLVSPDSPIRWPVAIGLAIVYTFGIMIIDREIVSSISKKSLLIRLPFAVFIAIVVSWPVKLKFFEGRVDVEISRMVEERNATKLERIEELKNTGEAERLQQRDSIRARMNSLDNEVAVLDEQILRESRVVECGPKCQEFRRQKEDLMVDRRDAEQALAALAARVTLPEAVQRDIDQLQADIEHERNVSYDFLTKWEALGRIKRAAGPDYVVMSWFLLLFFMLLELVPVFLKWSLGKTEYHYYIDARTSLNNQKIVALHNLFVNAMRRDPQVALEVPPEVTDIMAAHMEDEARQVSHRVDLRGLIERLDAAQKRAGSAEPRGAGLPGGERTDRADGDVPAPSAPPASADDGRDTVDQDLPPAR